MKVVILNETLRHEGIPVLSSSERELGYLGDEGHDTFPIELPSGYKFEKTELTLLSNHYKSGVRIEEQPPRSATGLGHIKVHWWFGYSNDPFNPSFIKYCLQATAVPAEPR